MQQRLYRNDHDRIIGGVCSGLANYLKVDVALVRVLMVVVTVILVASPILAYFILWIILPVNPIRFQQFYNSASNPSGTSNDPSSFNSANDFSYSKWNTPNFDASSNFEPHAFKPKRNDSSKRIVGAALMVIGILFLLLQLDILEDFDIILKLWPVALIVMGLLFFVNVKKDKDWEAFQKANSDTVSNQEEKKSEEPIVADNKSDI